MNKSIFIVLAFSFILNSCVTDVTCTQTTYVKLTAGFYHVIPNDTTSLYTYVPFSVDSLTVQGLKFDSTTRQYHLVDSILYNKINSQSSINLPLNNFALQSKFKITFNTIVDTLSIYHTNINDYLSLECGCIKLHTIDTVIMTKHYIDSVKITNHNVNALNAENIRLFK